MKRWSSQWSLIFALVLCFSWAQATESTSAVAEKMAETINSFDTYESVWKKIKVKDPAAYETLSLFLRRHGKEMVPAALASGDVVYFSSASNGLAWQSQMQVVQAKPLIIRLEGRQYTITNTSDAIALLEVRSRKTRQSLLQWLMGAEAIASGAPATAAPAAAPAALAAITSVAPLPEKSEYAGLKLDYNASVTGTAMIQALNTKSNVPLKCENFLKDNVTEIPGQGSGTFKLKYSGNDFTETFTFPKYKDSMTLQYRRTKDAQGAIPDGEVWYVCETEDCKSPKPFNKEKVLGMASTDNEAAENARKQALVRFEDLVKEYDTAAKTFNQSQQEKILLGSLTDFAEKKAYQKATPVSQIAQDLTNSTAWTETIRDSLKVMAKGSKSTLKGKGSLAPEQNYNDALLKKYMICSVYMRFQEEELFAKECKDDEANIVQFQEAVGPRDLNKIIDNKAMAVRPLKVPAKYAKGEMRVRNKQRHDLLFLTKEDAAPYEKALEPSFVLASLCRRIERLANGITPVPVAESNERTTSCLIPNLYEKDIAKMRSSIKTNAADKPLKSFEEGPQAAANFAGAIAKCCLSAPCKRGLIAGTMLRDGTFAAPSAEAAPTQTAAPAQKAAKKSVPKSTKESTKGR